MTQWLLTFGCLASYISGLILLVKITPSLLRRSFDDTLFIGVAAGAVVGAMLSFGALGITYALFNGSAGVRVLDIALSLILAIVSLRISASAFRPRHDISVSTYRSSRIMAGSFFLLLGLVAIYVLIMLFKPA